MTPKEFRRHCQRKGYELPDSYVAYLERMDVSELRHPKTEGVVWQILDLSKSGLLKVLDFEGITVEFWELPRAIGEVLSESGISKLSGEHMPIQDFQQGVVFGKTGGDYLFLLANESVWCFWHDGHEVERLASSWTEWEKESAAIASLDSEIDSQLLGTWIPVHSDSTPADLLNVMWATLELHPTGVAIEHCSDGNSLDGGWTADGSILMIGDSAGTADYRYKVENDDLELRRIGGRGHCRYTRTSSDA